MISIAAGTVIPPRMLQVWPIGPESVMCRSASAIARYEAIIVGSVSVRAIALSCMRRLRFWATSASLPATKNTPSENSTTLNRMLKIAA